MAEYKDITTETYIGDPPIAPSIVETIRYYDDLTGQSRSNLLKTGYLLVGTPPLKWRPPTTYTRRGISYTRSPCTLTQQYQVNAAYSVHRSRLVHPGNTTTPLGEVESLVTKGAFKTTHVEVVNAQNRAITQALASANDTDANFGQMAFEARMAGNYIARRHNILFVLAHAGKTGTSWSRKRAMRALRLYSREFRRDSNDMLSRIHSVSDFWLAYQYAIKPLMADLYTAHQAMTKRMSLESFTFKTSSEVKVEMEGKEETRGGWTGRTKANISVSCDLWYRVTSPAMRNAATVGLVNPSTIAWELTPWSFVLDWLVPIGNTLGALNQYVGTKYMGGTLATRLGYRMEAQVAPVPGWTITSPGSLVKDSYLYTRSVLVNRPLPRVYIKSPFSTSHVATAAALHASSLPRGNFKQG